MGEKGVLALTHFELKIVFLILLANDKKVIVIL